MTTAAFKPLHPNGLSMTTTAQWYDLDRNRRIQFFVDYSVCDGALDVHDIRPTGITFYRDDGQMRVDRQINVQTARGRELLVDQLFDSGEAYNLTLSLARRHGLLTKSD